MWLILAIITAVCWGISIATVKRAYSSLTPVMWIILGAIASVLILVPYALFNGVSLVFWPLIPVSVLVAGCYAFYGYALDKGKVSLVATVQSIYPLFAVLLATIFLRETTSLFVKGGILAIITGVVLLSLENPRGLKSTKIGRWLLWGLVAAMLGGFGDFISKISISNFDPYTYMVGFAIGEIVIAVIAAILDKKNIKPLKANRDLFWMIVSVGSLYLGYLFFYSALNIGLASLVVPITGLYGIVTFGLAILWLKEKVTKLQLIGVIITILGAVVVSSM